MKVACGNSNVHSRTSHEMMLMKLPRQEFDAVDHLKQAIVLEWHALPQSFTDHGIGE